MSFRLGKNTKIKYKRRSHKSEFGTHYTCRVSPTRCLPYSPVYSANFSVFVVLVLWSNLNVSDFK